MRWLLIGSLWATFLTSAHSASAEELDWFSGDKLVLTNGVSTIEGTSGGGLATWATIAGRATDAGVGISGHVTAIELADFRWQSHGIAIGIANRIELSYARQNFDTLDAGTTLGLGRGYTLNQDVFGAKVRIAGDLVYGNPALPQIAIGLQHKRNLDSPVTQAVGAATHQSTDVTISATKLILSRSLLVNATLRLTEANEGGLLGFGSATGKGHSVQIEGSLGYQLSRRALIGAELRTKPDNLDLGESNWFDLFAAYAVTDNVTVTAAYVDLGKVATFEKQHGAFLSAQVAF